MRHVLGVAKVFFLSAVICAFSGSAKAQDDSKDLSPQEVYQLAGEAMRALDYEKFTSYMHPEALSNLKDMMWEAIESSPKNSIGATPIEMYLGARFDENGLISMTPHEFFISLLKDLELLAPGLEKALIGSQDDFIGEVSEGDTLVHVLSRLHVEVKSLSVTQMQVTSLKMSENGWKMILSGRLDGIRRYLLQLQSR